MEPSSQVQFAGSADQGHGGGSMGSEQEDPEKVPQHPEKSQTRQCGRCRLHFPLDVSLSPQPKWWACSTCRLKLFGSE
jgi:hypothetical protein